MMSFSPSCIFDLKIWGFQWLTLISSLEKVDSFRSDSSQDVGEGFQNASHGSRPLGGPWQAGFFQNVCIIFLTEKGSTPPPLTNENQILRHF